MNGVDKRAELAGLRDESINTEGMIYIDDVLNILFYVSIRNIVVKIKTI